MVEIAVIVSIFFTGLFAGVMVTFMVVIRRALAGASAGDYTRLWQRITNAIDKPPTAPVIVLLGVLAPLVTLFGLRGAVVSLAFFLTLLAWLVFTFGVLGVTLAFNAPINNAFLRSSPEAPPENWARLRDRWNSFSSIRTIASVAAFLLHILVLLQVAAMT